MQSRCFADCYFVVECCGPPRSIYLGQKIHYLGQKIHIGLCWLIIADLQILPCRNMMRCKSVTQSPVAEWQSDLGQANVGNLSLIIVCPVVGASLASQSSDLACRQDRYYLTLRTRKIRRVALKTQGFKTKPKVFFFSTNFKTMPPNALILLMRWVLKKCCISVQSTGHRRPNTSPNTTKTYYIFTSSKGFQPMFYIIGAHG